MNDEKVDPRNWDEIMDEMANAVDILGEAELMPGTPIYNFQQEMISHVKRYREAKARGTNK